MEFPQALSKAVANHRYSLLFATVSGAHLYGFPSPDSDFDLRGVHVFPMQELIGLDEPNETIEITNFDDGIELDLVTHDLKKFILLMLKPNGYVLEIFRVGISALVSASRNIWSRDKSARVTVCTTCPG